MFAGDMLFYGQWASGAAAYAGSMGVVEGRPIWMLMLGGLLGPLAGIGYLFGLLHVVRRLRPAGRLLQAAVGFSLLAVFSIAMATHSVWGAFAVAAGARQAVGTYLQLFFVVGQIVAVPASLLLLGVTAMGRTTWPRATVLANPGVLYLVLVTATWLPSPVGAVIVGGAFNLAFAFFFTVSLATDRDG
ncbi:hypothetical protein [Brevundimonas sp.]|uniref:hypothetical protein n=1 Tax=Brevundimonas sp. TaxID=1871086 RepID=UPI002FC7FF86